MALPARLALTSEIEELKRQFEQLANAADTLVAPLNDDQFIWKAAPEKWSIAQCIDHLNVTARLSLPLFDEGIGDAIRQGLYSEGPFTYSWPARLAARILEPPVRLRFRSPVPFSPPPERTRQEIMAA